MHSAAYFGKFSILSDLLNRMPKNSVEVRDRYVSPRLLCSGAAPPLTPLAPPYPCLPTRSNGNTVLHYCAEGGDRSLGCLALLLNNKNVNRDSQNDLGHTALHIAAMRGLENTMHALLLSGVKRDVPDGEGNTPLHTAGENRFYRCRDLLLANGASATVRNRRGLTPEEVTPPPQGPLCNPKPDCCRVS